MPFIVIFCNVIETSNPDDMRILGEFSESLKPICDTSEAVQKLHDLCQVLYNVAVIYVEAKAQNPQDHDVPVENGFGAYLGIARGALQVDGSHCVASLTTLEDLMSHTGNHASQLRDWIPGNTQMMGISEEDLSEFLAQLG